MFLRKSNIPSGQRKQKSTSKNQETPTQNNSTELSKCMWKLKDGKITANTKWNIMSILHGTPKGGVCRLCLTGKFWFLKHFNDKHLLNKKSEFISKCRHENKLLVKSVEKS